MPSYRLNSGAVRQAIVDRIAAGERLKVICREAGMPCQLSVNRWMRLDAGFAAQVAQARGRADWRRRLWCDDEAAKAVLAAVAAGERLETVCGRPGMPSYRTVAYWRRTVPWFAEEMGRLMGVRAAAKAHRLRARFRAFDPAVAERIYLRVWKGERLRKVLGSDKAFPCLTVLERWRREEPAFDRMLKAAMQAWRRKRGRDACLCTPELTGAIVDLIVEGESLRSLSRRPGMPSQKAMYNWHRTRPEFAAAVDQACEDREDWYREAILEVAQGPWPGSVRAANKRLAPLVKQMTRLRKRPGWKRRRRAAALTIG